MLKGNAQVDTVKMAVLEMENIRKTIPKDRYVAQVPDETQHLRSVIDVHPVVQDSQRHTSIKISSLISMRCNEGRTMRERTYSSYTSRYRQNFQQAELERWSEQFTEGIVLLVVHTTAAAQSGKASWPFCKKQQALTVTHIGHSRVENTPYEHPPFSLLEQRWQAAMGFSAQGGQRSLAELRCYVVVSGPKKLLAAFVILVVTCRLGDQADLHDMRVECSEPDCRNRVERERLGEVRQQHCGSRKGRLSVARLPVIGILRQQRPATPSP
jgi:hypothetical protein